MWQGLAFLIWLLCVGISAILIGYFIKQSSNPVRKEGFAILTCPSNTSSYVTGSGFTRCCNGDIVDGNCTGNVICTLSPKDISSIPKCTDLAASNAAAAGANRCPTAMPNYFAARDNSLKGCSASEPTIDGTAPSDSNQPQCILYATEALEKSKLDSCYNYTLNLANKEIAALPACAAAAAARVEPKTPAPSSNCPPPPACPSR